jgi:tRNA dimethylallyltransferase
VVGPTASGKSELAETLADQLSARLINADAFQVYRGLDIGTAKPKERQRYELLDIKDPSEAFGVGQFVSLALDILSLSFSHNENVIVVGGTGLYIRALFEEYSEMFEAPPQSLREELSQESLEKLVEILTIEDPNVAKRLDLKNRARVQRAVERIRHPSTSLPRHLPDFRRIKLGLVPPKDITELRIELRVSTMMQEGWIDELERLRRNGTRFEDPGLRAIGYRAFWKAIDGEIELGEAFATTIAETRRYAKRQRTWLRSEPNLIELDWKRPAKSALEALSSI